MTYDPTIRAQYTLAKEPTGFANRFESTISFNDGSRTLTIQPVASEYRLFLRGVLHRKVDVDEVTIDNVEGLWYIYFNQLGVLQATNTPTPSLFVDYAMVAIVYWDLVNLTAIYVADERHGHVMDGVTHTYLHNSVGAAFINGFALGDFDIGDGDSGSNARLSVANGLFYDEDMAHNVVGGAPQTLAPVALLPVLYRVGSSGVWRKKAATDYPIITCAEAGILGNRLTYNQWTGSVWTRTEVDNNGFVLAHIFATNDINTPIFAIQGLNQYGNVPAARAAAPTEIASLSGLPFAEIIPIGSVIYQTADAYESEVKARVVLTDTGETYVDMRQISTLPVNQVNDHGNLSGLTDQDHPASAIRVDASGFSGALSATDTDVQTALNTLDTIAAVPALDVSRTASEIIAIGELVAFTFTTGSRIQRADANAGETQSIPVGFAVSATTGANQAITVRIAGIALVPISSFTSPAPTTSDVGKRVYMSTEPGQVTMTPPSPVLSYVQRVGVLASVSELTAEVLINIGDPVVVQ